MDPFADAYVPVGYVCDKCRQKDVLLLQRHLQLEERNRQVRQLAIQVENLTNSNATLTDMIRRHIDQQKK